MTGRRVPADTGGVQCERQVGDVLAILQLKARYAWLADSKYSVARKRRPRAAVDRAARAQANCFTVDALWEGGKDFGARITGRDALFQFFRRGPWQFALHYYVAPIIEVHGDRARGWWRLWQVGIPRGKNEAVLLAAVTSEDYLRVRGRWLHRVVHFEHLHFLRSADGAGFNVLPSLA